MGLPTDVAGRVEVQRGSWSPQPVFRALAEFGGIPLQDSEGTWNLGVGMFAVVQADAAASVIAFLENEGIPSWVAGEVSTAAHDLSGFEQGAKGVNGGAVRLAGNYA